MLGQPSGHLTRRIHRCFKRNKAKKWETMLAIRSHYLGRKPNFYLWDLGTFGSKLFWIRRHAHIPNRPYNSIWTGNNFNPLTSRTQKQFTLSSSVYLTEYSEPTTMTGSFTDTKSASSTTNHYNYIYSTLRPNRLTETGDTYFHFLRSWSKDFPVMY